MSEVFDDLRHEHEAILFAVGILEKMISLVGEGRLRDPADPLALIAFIREFADKCHHGKEELILFPALEKAGIRKEGGPIGVMLGEHDLGRKHIGNMEAALKDRGDFAAFAVEAGKYASLIRQHIDKENSVLFPMGERVLGTDTAAAIFVRFEEHEEKVIGAGRHDELHAMLDAFDRKYMKVP